MSLTRYAGARDRFIDYESKLVFAVAVAHGAALVTLGGIVGNIGDPDFAIRSLKWAICAFAAGLFSALWAIQQHVVLVSLQTALAVEEDAFGWANGELGKLPTDSFRSVDFESAAVVFGSVEAAKEAYRQFMFKALQNDNSRADKVQAAAEASIGEQRTKAASVAKVRGVFNRWQSIAIGLGFAGTVALGIALVSGLQPPKADEPPIEINIHISVPTAEEQSSTSPAISRPPSPSSPPAVTSR